MRPVTPGKAGTMFAHSQQTRRLIAKHKAGMTLLELVIACAILLILATAAMPVARFTVKRQKKLICIGLCAKCAMRLTDTRMRRIRAHPGGGGTEGYPPDLQTLVSGVDVVSQGVAGAPLGAGVAGGLGIGGAAGGAGAGTLFGATNPASTFNTAPASGAGTLPPSQHIRFLRQIPIDPMTGRAEWGLRAVQDDSDSSSWGGMDVFDVYSLSQGTGLNNIKYSDW